MTAPRPPINLEPAVSRYDYGDVLAAQISAAVSLKRIADMMEAMAKPTITPTGFEGGQKI
jgi:hypothetical protein